MASQPKPEQVKNVKDKTQITEEETDASKRNDFLQRQQQIAELKLTPYDTDQGRIAPLRNALHELLHVNEDIQAEIIEPLENSKDRKRLLELLNKIKTKTSDNDKLFFDKWFDQGMVYGLMAGASIILLVAFFIMYSGNEGWITAAFGYIKTSLYS